MSIPALEIGQVFYEVCYNLDPMAMLRKEFVTGENFIVVGSGTLDMKRDVLEEIFAFYNGALVSHSIDPTDRNSHCNRSMSVGDVVKLYYPNNQFRAYRCNDEGFSLISSL